MDAYAMTDVGLCRDRNQDYLFCCIDPVGQLPNLFIVADGMGGHRAGDFASEFTVNKIVELIKESEFTNPITVINNAIRQTNRILVEKSLSDDELKGMGTTLALATIIDKTLHVGNVGDSRVYVIGSEIHQVSRDHSYVEELIQSGNLIRGSDEYWKKKNIITRAIGGTESVIPDFFEIPLTGSEKILLCSDGLTNMVEDEEILDIIQKNEGLENQVKELIHLANRNGGRDNIAVVLVDPSKR